MRLLVEQRNNVSYLMCKTYRKETDEERQIERDREIERDIQRDRERER